MEQADEQLARAPLALPQMYLNPDVTDLYAFKYEDFDLQGYEAHPHIAAKVAV
jgi:thymidylate synthase